MDGQRVMMKDGGILTVTNELVEKLVAKSRYVSEKDRKSAIELVVGSDLRDDSFKTIQDLMKKYMEDKNILNKYIVKSDSELGKEIKKLGTKRVKIYKKGDSIGLIFGYRYKMKRYALRKDLDLELVQEGDVIEPFLNVGIDFISDWSGALVQALKIVSNDGLYSNETLEEAKKLKVELMDADVLGDLIDDYTRKMKVIKDKLVS